MMGSAIDDAGLQLIKRNMKKACLRNITLHVSVRCFDLNLQKKSFQMPELVKVDHKNNAQWRK